MKPFILTEKKLRDMGACGAGIEAFRAVAGKRKRIVVTEQMLVADTTGYAPWVARAFRLSYRKSGDGWVRQYSKGELVLFRRPDGSGEVTVGKVEVLFDPAFTRCSSECGLCDLTISEEMPKTLTAARRRARELLKSRAAARTA